MSAAIVNGEHLDVLVIATTVAVFVLDSKIREVDLVIEVGQVMLQCPRADFLLVAIGMAVVLVSVASCS